MSKDEKFKIDYECKMGDETLYHTKYVKQFFAKQDDIFERVIFEDTNVCAEHKILSKEELHKFLKYSIETPQKIIPLVYHIERVLEETESMTSISAEQRLRNEMRYIKEELEKLEEIVYEN